MIEITPKSANTQIIVPTAEQQEAVTALITLAFSTDPVVRWMYPDSQQYLSCSPQFFKVFVATALAHRSAYCIEGYRGAALWLPPDTQADENSLISLFQRTVAKDRQAALFNIMEQMNSYHPEEAHWYLPLIGIDPIYQKLGYGSALLKHTLEICDRNKRPVYLESTNPRNIPLYQRHGFKLLATIQMGSSPRIFPMLRAIY
jgi:GNAT superfamily N-acetyltransferase